jgi:hypothetical protein
VSTSLFSSVVEEGLKGIPNEDKVKMTSFFDYSIKVCHAGYVLFFDSKPVSIISFWTEDNSTAKFKDGWDIFKKYEHLFPHKNYIFDEQQRKISSKESIQIFLINKKSFIDCINRHSNVFHEILHQKIDGLKFVHEIENGKHLMDLIEDNEILLGILLGYGEESSKLYNIKQVESMQNKIPDKSYITITSELTDDIEILPVAFKGNVNSQEARKLNSKFQEEWKSLWTLYQKKNQDSTSFFLESLCR